MKADLKIFVKKDWDRVIFVHFNKNKEVVGINFHQGVDDIQMSYAESDPQLFNIFLYFKKRAEKKGINYKELDLVEKAIKLHVELFILSII